MLKLIRWSLLFFAISCNRIPDEVEISENVYMKGTDDAGYIVYSIYRGKELYHKYSDDTKDTTAMIKEAKAALKNYKQNLAL